MANLVPGVIPIPAAVFQDASPSPTGLTDQATLAEVTLPADVLPFEMVGEDSM